MLKRLFKWLGGIVLILLFKPSGLFGSAVKGVWEQ